MLPQFGFSPKLFHAIEYECLILFKDRFGVGAPFTADHRHDIAFGIKQTPIGEPGVYIVQDVDHVDTVVAGE